METWSGTSSGSAGLQEERKRKRMLSNRESARRLRQRKQKRLDELAVKAGRLRGENARLLAALAATAHGHLVVESENSVLRMQAAELAARLHSLDDILLYVNINLLVGIDIDIGGPPRNLGQPLADMLHYC